MSAQSSHFVLIRCRQRPSASATNTSCKGFTLVELIVGAVILMIVASGTAVLLVSSNRQLSAARAVNERQAVVDQDLAEILQRNDRYSCSNLPASGAAASNCAVAGVEPNENQYTPLPVVTASFSGSGYERFLNLCSAGTLTAALITDIQSVAPPAGITRTVVAADAGPPFSHRYRVTWSDATSGEQLRRQVLVPTVAGWCQ